MNANFVRTITRNCTQCHTPHVVTVKVRDYEAWKAGRLIQDVMSYLTDAEREMLISGVCDDCFPADAEDIMTQGTLPF